MIRVRACTMRGDATAIAADPDSPSSAPRSAENDPLAASAGSVAHPGDPSFACVLAWHGSRPRLQSTTQSATRPAIVRTNARARWPPSPHAPFARLLQERDRTSPPPRNAPVFFPETLRCRYPLKLFAETRGGNLLL